MEEPENYKTILIFSDWYYPGYKAGGPVQSVYNLSVLLSKYFNVKVVTGIYDLNSEEPYPEIEPDSWVTLKTRHQVIYLNRDGNRKSIIKQLVKDNKDNVILINGLFSYYFSILPLYYVHIYNIRRSFIAVRGMLHKSALSVKPLKKQIFLAFARGFRLYGKSILLSTSEVESREIKMSLGNPEIRFAPNIPIRPHEIFNGETTFKSNDKPVEFLFLGRISPEKNPINLLRALQNINKPCKVTFCGSFLDKSYLTRFQEELARVKLPVICEYIGDIPHPIVKDLIRTNDVLVLPSLGENFGHSIFESFVSAVPVIIGNNTPWKSIESIKAGIEVNPDDINEISSAIQRFIQMDIDEYLLWKKGAYDLSISYFESNNFEQIYLKLFS